MDVDETTVNPQEEPSKRPDAERASASPHIPRLTSHTESAGSTTSFGKDAGPSVSTSRTSAPSERLQLDRFASVYVSKWLLEVNSALPIHVYLPDTSHTQDLTAYAESIYPKKLIDDMYTLEQREEREISDLLAQGNSNLPHFAEAAQRQHAYVKRFLPLQFMEHAARKEDLAQANLYNVPLEPFKDTNTLHLYKLQAPAIREGWPPLEPNDVVHLRQLRPGVRRWQGIEFVATVHATRRVQGFVILKCQALAQHIETMHFNVTFRPQGRQIWVKDLSFGLPR